LITDAPSTPQKKIRITYNTSYYSIFSLMVGMIAEDFPIMLPSATRSDQFNDSSNIRTDRMVFFT